jgi:hypothetical protein
VVSGADDATGRREPDGALLEYHLRRWDVPRRCAAIRAAGYGELGRAAVFSVSPFMDVLETVK